MPEEEDQNERVDQRDHREVMAGNMKLPMRILSVRVPKAASSAIGSRIHGGGVGDCEFTNEVFVGKFTEMNPVVD
ncbi:hypothetical protein SLEP1_g31605 [Rubroshorea leprosula]|uniref:Uncharacterized protein n=1 Tax=Rubroshorea leprosula TaxID=152421 RepID=A0AAV5KA33_9ROSI|nr:hypothetical protein SLEP1_g31605 [Rubroshorea leprosula]